MADDDTERIEEGKEEDMASLPLGKRIMFSVVLLCLSLGVATILAEITVRVVAPQQLIMVRPDIWASVDSLGWSHAANLDTQVNTGERLVSFRTDAEGFRVGAEGRKVAADSILLIGDSFMAALQVEHEQSLAGLLEDSLRGPEGQTAAVRNAGVGSWGPAQYLIFGRRRLAEHRYSLAVVSVFTGNDIVATRDEYVPGINRGEPAEFRIPFSLSPRAWIRHVAKPINNSLETQSHFFVFLKNRLEPLRIRLGLSAAYVPRGILRETADGPRWEVTADILADLQEAADSADVPIVFVLIPAQYQVDLELFENHADAFGISEAAVDLDQPNERLANELEVRGLDAVDVLPAFREAKADGAVLYGSVDSHLSPNGHHVLFELLQDDLTKRMRWSGS